MQVKKQFVADEFEFEAVDACMLCGSSEQFDAQGVSRLGLGFSYCYCGHCGLKYMRPRPTQASYQRFYQDAYWQQIVNATTYATFSGANDPRIDQRELRLQKFRKIYRRVKRDIASTIALGAQSRVLEVGCGMGVNLELLARDYGCQVFGIEPSSEALGRCAEAACITIVARNAEDYLAPGGPVAEAEKYDLVLIRHCLENLVDPRSVLHGIRRYLRDGGLLLIYTPNVEYFEAMNPYHPYIYSPETLSRLLALTGFMPIEMRAPPTPRDHATAVGVTAPSYEIVSFSRPDAPREPVLPTVSPQDLAAFHRRGREVMAWSELGLRDLARRLVLQTGRRIVRALQRDR